MIKNFSVQKNKEKSRIVAGRKKLMIMFFANTIIKVVTDNAPSISRYKFEFFPFEKLVERDGKDFVLTGKAF